MQDTERFQCFGRNANSLDGINISFVNDIFTSLNKIQRRCWRMGGRVREACYFGRSFARKLTIEETVDILEGQF